MKQEEFVPDETGENEPMMDINADADVPGNTHLTDPLPDNSEHSTEIESLTTALQEQKDKYLRQAAEFENYKRRTSKERIDLLQTAGKDIIVSLLEVLDDTERAEKQMQSADTKPESIIDGNKLVFAKLKNILQQRGLKAMHTVGSDFDVEQHEAITEVEVPQDKKGKVIDEVQKGYLLNDKIIRFAKVVVGK